MATTWRLLAILGSMFIAACGSNSGTPDAGDAGFVPIDAGPPPQPPSVSISAQPTTGVTGLDVTFTGAITGGTPPYRTCNVRFESGASTAAGTINGSSCTATHAYATSGTKAVSMEVGDNAARIGTGFLSYEVFADGGGGGDPDLTIPPGSFALVAPPPFNRYQPGGSIQVQVTVRNGGAGPAPATIARVTIKNLVSNAEAVLGNISIMALNANAQQEASQTFTIDGAQAQGSYDIFVVVDPDNAISEDIESNNMQTLSGGIAIEFPPDGG